MRKLNADFIAALNDPELRARLAELGFEVFTDTPEQLDDYIRA